jgi:hypothetical protein
MARLRVQLSICSALNILDVCLSYGDLLITPLNPSGVEQRFSISQGESV